MKPDYTSLGARLAERAGPLQPPELDAQYDYAFGHLTEGMMRMYKDVADLVDPDLEGYSPWQPLFDVDVCPEWALPWLAQVVGVRIPKILTGEQARQYIKDLSFEQIGKPATIEAVVRSFLTDSKTVYFREREGGDAYVLEVVTLISETPDPDRLLEALLASVPAGIVVHFRMVSGWDYQAMTAEGGLYSSLPPKFANYEKMTDNERLDT